jgi:hypothetical protein
MQDHQGSQQTMSRLLATIVGVALLTGGLSVARWSAQAAGTSFLSAKKAYAQEAQIALRTAILATYGPGSVVGEMLEACDNAETVPGARLVSTSEPWQDLLENEAQPGETILLRGGVYHAAGKLDLPAGESGRPITIKPYQCEAVTLRAELRPHSHNVVAGLRIESDWQWVIRLDGKDDGRIEDVVIRNNTILGGVIDAIRLRDDVVDVRIAGNHIDGGSNGHGIFVTSETKMALPDRILITQNLLTKGYYGTPAEDMFQVRDVGAVTFSYNTCSNGRNMEQCVDIKSATTPLVISHNFFDGDNMHLEGGGEDGSGGCMVIHESDGSPEWHRIEDNFFRNCKDTIIRFATGGLDESSSAQLRNNLFLNPPATDDDLAIVGTPGLEFIHNTMVNGVFRLGSSSRTPQGVVIKNNIFSGSIMDDRTGGVSVTCTHNLFNDVSGDSISGFCAAAIFTDPRFVDPPAFDFRLQSDSPALGSGDDGSDLGAYPSALPANPMPEITPAPTTPPTSIILPTSTPTALPSSPLIFKIYLTRVVRNR